MKRTAILGGVKNQSLERFKGFHTLAYITALHEIYPPARGNTSVTVRPEYGVMVHVPLPKRASERIRLFEQMAEVGTRLLLETDEYIILSGR